MIQQWLNWRTILALIAISIVVGTIFYSDYLATKIAKEETYKVELWVEAQRTILNAPEGASLNLSTKILTENDDIPIIETNEKDSVTNNFLNIDSGRVARDPQYLWTLLEKFKKLHPPIELVLSQEPYMANRYYYGESRLQKEVRYYPIIQLVIIALFIIITIVAQKSRYHNTQNQVWAGLAKETAHQLGTPVTSLEGWVEVLKDMQGNEKIWPEIEKDVNRLKLISDRFGKIGSTPKLEETNIVEQVGNMVEYIKKRAGGKVVFAIDTQGENNILALISPPLFDWVIENLLKNALDAMDGKGRILIHMVDETSAIIIDVTDTGKGISKSNIGNVFRPGFTTKKRGWGLGLTLTKRIVEQYHRGQIFVKHSEPGKGTTFRIILKK